jgi:hypothetical protein
VVAVEKSESDRDGMRNEAKTMSSTALLALQSALIAGQVINAGLGSITQNPAAHVLVSRVLGGLQYFLQSVGNAKVPEVSKVQEPPHGGL